MLKLHEHETRVRLFAGFVLRAAVVSGIALATGMSGAALAQNQPKYEVSGFRDARFGMSEQEVRAVAIKNLGIKPADLAASTNQVEGTSVLTAKVASLDPAPGPAQVTYIFGHSSKKLIQVNVVWGDAQAKSKIDVNAMVAAGARLERYFASFGWRKDATRAGIPVGDNTVVLFAGEDDKKGAVRLIADGVKYQMQREGKEATSPDPKGPARLIINYIADRENPDIAKIDKGKF